MRILGADVRELTATGGAGTIVALDPTGAVAAAAPVEGLTALAREVSRLSGGDPFLLAVDTAVVAPSSPDKPRRVDRWLHRRLAVKLASARGGAAAPVGGSDLLAALATAGQPCVPYPDRDRRRSGLAEIHPEPVAKALLWELSAAAAAAHLPDRESLFRALGPSPYRRRPLPRAGWAERWAAVETAAGLLGGVAGFDLRPVREALGRAVTEDAVERAASLLDAILLAGTALRYLDEPERCVFAGDRETGYVVLPADALVRRIARNEGTRPSERAPLFPRASLQQRLAGRAVIRPLELVGIPGRAQQIEAVFEAPPLYEFDNCDEMLWWKHCRHLDGPEVPADGLREIVVRLQGDGRESGGPLRLTRSRHKTLSFRFEPPSAWRAKVPPRDGKTYPFHVQRAVYEVE
jgi:hypothetical protein